MRDANRLKEKYDLSLDNRQIVSLVIAGVVVLGAVFVLGVVVGKKLSTDDKAAGAPDLLTALDERAAAMDQAKADPPLTAQRELTAPAPPAPTGPGGPASIQTPSSAPPDAAVELEPLPPAPSKPAEVQVVTADRPDAAAPANVNPKLGQAIDRARAAPETAPNGAWTLQLSASQDKKEADRFAGRLRDQGYAPYIVEAAVPGRGKWYRVRMGSFPSKDAANRYLKDFKRETQLDAFVTGTN